jgi:hypothetical protein
MSEINVEVRYSYSGTISYPQGVGRQHHKDVVVDIVSHGQGSLLLRHVREQNQVVLNADMS